MRQPPPQPVRHRAGRRQRRADARGGRRLAGAVDPLRAEDAARGAVERGGAVERRSGAVGWDGVGSGLEDGDYQSKV